MQGHIKWVVGAVLDAGSHQMGGGSSARCKDTHWRCLTRLLLLLIYLCGEVLLSETIEGSGRSRSAQSNSPPGFLNTCKKLQCLPLGHLPLSKSPERESGWESDKEKGGGEEGERKSSLNIIIFQSSYHRWPSSISGQGNIRRTAVSGHTNVHWICGRPLHTPLPWSGTHTHACTHTHMHTHTHHNTG